MRVLTEEIHAIEGVVSAESFVLLEIHKLAYGWGVGEVEVAPSQGNVAVTDRRERRPLRSSS
jgi:Lrp/AsnC family transcriptional regulator for asnA, asnC and gidA